MQINLSVETGAAIFVKLEWHPSPANPSWKVWLCNERRTLFSYGWGATPDEAFAAAAVDLTDKQTRFEKPKDNLLKELGL